MIRRLTYCVALFALLIVTGCEIPAEAPVESISRVDEYFWKPSIDTFRYDVYSGMTAEAVRHSIWVDQFADGYIAHDRANDQTGIIISRSEANRVVLTDISANSLFPLPQGAYIANGGSLPQVKNYLPVNALLFDKNNSVVFNDRGSFFNSIKNWQATDWSSSSTSVFGRITVVTASETGVLYAGNSIGALFQSGDGGKNWKIIRPSGGGEVKGIVVVDSNVVIAVHGVGVLVSRVGSVFEQLGSSSIPKNVTGIALVTRSSQYSDNEVIVSTDDNGIWFGALNGSYWRMRPQTGVLNGQPITGLYGYKNELSYVATGVGGVFYISIDTGQTWVMQELPSYANGEEITKIARLADGRILIGTTRGRVLQTFIQASVVEQVTLIDTIVNDLTYHNDRLIVGSNNGLYEFSIALSADLGPYEMRDEPSHGEFILLQSDGGELKVEDSWLAGYLYYPEVPLPDKRIPLTARVMERLDTLHMLGESYSDVIAIRYAFEVISGTPLVEVPYWMIYYSRGIGPVMIDQILLSSNNAKLNTSRALYRRQ